MLQIKNGSFEIMPLINAFFNEVVSKDGFYKPLSIDEYREKITSIPGFSYDGIFVAYQNNEIVGLAIAIIKNEKVGHLNCLLVKNSYRHQGIGNLLLEKVESYFKELHLEEVYAYGYLPSCYGWYIPHTDFHDHPCAPGIRMNSDEYFFLLHHQYRVSGIQDAFHLNLVDYEINKDISQILEENQKLGLTIELYDENKHKGIDEFCEKLNIYDFEKVIKENLSLKKPFPFLVVVQDGKIKGWTGAMWNEESGRGHFDGIAILPEIRGKGLGKALFSLLAYHSKLNGAKFMTFYTGITNHARYIYMGAGFKIIQSFAIMKKELK